MYSANRSDRIIKVDPISSGKKSNPIKYDSRISNVSFKKLQEYEKSNANTESTPQKKYNLEL